MYLRVNEHTRQLSLRITRTSVTTGQTIRGYLGKRRRQLFSPILIAEDIELSYLCGGDPVAPQQILCQLVHRLGGVQTSSNKHEVVVLTDDAEIQ